ncbi:thiamine pyrophosphate-binding protein [Micrococcus luteus]|uniref:thiamine pyrophosphate-binding protein n=1 Tax=Micrococcus luteus TaxID=1270 RepID=UPI0015D78478|nr:thiamine pyrophosphate-binding protein [Micrococcus luteus]
MTRPLPPWALVAHVLRRHGADHVYGLPDDDMQSLARLTDVGISFHRFATQRTAVAAAAGEALARRAPAVAIIGRGPAVAASTSALLEARASRAPLVLLCSESVNGALGTRAFQWVDSAQLLAPAVDLVLRAEDGEGLARHLDAALCRAGTANAGPVAIVVPDGIDPVPLPTLPHRTDVGAILRSAAESPRTVLLVGGGARAVLTAHDVEGLAAQLGAGILVTASGRGGAREDSDHFLGLSGLYLTQGAQGVLAQADTVLVLGSRLEETTVEGMPADASWLQVQVDPMDVARELPGEYAIADVRELTRAPVPSGHADPDWLRAVASASASAARSGRAGTPPSSVVERVLGELTDALPDGSRVVHENGLHDISSHLADRFSLPAGGDAVALSEQTTLGFGAAAAVGIAVAEAHEHPPRLTVCITGDGAFLTLLTDLAMLESAPLHLLYVVLDDGGYGWLERQARGEGISGRFTGGPRRVAEVVRAAHHADVLVLADPSSTARCVREAIAAAAGGRPTVLVVPCEVDDALTLPITMAPDQEQPHDAHDA